MRNHNHLLGSVEGVDGIKTGFTRASGFNLSDLGASRRPLYRRRRHGRPFGRPSATPICANLISEHIKEAALRRTAPMIADAATSTMEAQPVAFGKAPLRRQADRAAPRADPAPTGERRCARRRRRNDPIQPLLVKTITLPHRAGADVFAGADAGAGAGRRPPPRRTVRGAAAERRFTAAVAAPSRATADRRRNRLPDGSRLRRPAKLNRADRDRHGRADPPAPTAPGQAAAKPT